MTAWSGWWRAALLAAVLGPGVGAGDARGLVQVLRPGAATLVVGEDGRSRLARSGERYGVITVGGADANLYTVDAFEEYLRHLEPKGVLVVEGRGTEAVRLMVLGLEGLGRIKARAVWRQVGVIRRGDVDTVLIAPKPWTQGDEALVRQFVKENGFRTVYLPSDQEQSIYSDLLWAGDRKRWLAAQREDVSAPTDDRPFFFHRERRRWVMLRVAALLLLLALPGAAGRWRVTASGAGAAVVAWVVVLRLGLLLGSPGAGAAVGLGGLAVGAGVAAWWPWKMVRLGAALVVPAAMLLVAEPMGWSLGVRCVAAGLLGMLLGFAMGAVGRAAAGTMRGKWLVWVAAAGVGVALAALTAVESGLSVTMAVGGALLVSAGRRQLC